MPNIDAFSRYSNVQFFHFTDTRNLDSIREHGLLSWAELSKRGIAVPQAGGNDWSHDADVRFGIDDYVHLCFKNQHPMEYKAKNDGRIQASLFIEIDPQIRFLPGVLMTLDVSNKSGVRSISIDDAAKDIDFEVLYTKTDWRDPAINQRLQAVKKYELLVPKQVDLKYIRNL